MSHPAAGAVQTFNAPPQRVYAAILDPAMIARFIFGSLLREEEILDIGDELKVGGAFSYKVRRGEHVIDPVGEFPELHWPHSIVFTWAIAGESDDDPSTVTIDIPATTTGCSLRLTHEMAPEWAEFVERSRAGWQKMFGVLASLL